MTKHRFLTAVVLLTVYPGTGPADARDRGKAETDAAPASITALSNCRKLADGGQRLACYDQAVAALDTAISTNDIYVVDKASVRKTRSSLFGLQLPNLGLFDRDSTDTNAVSQLEGIIASAAQDGYGDWRMTLESGAIWV